MSSPSPKVVFDQAQASEYDRHFAKLAPMRDALHLLINAVFSELPAQARILCVGAGTGAEIIHLAQKNPGWHFTAVEPSAPMLAVFRRKAEECGITARCEFHEGYLDSLPPSEDFDAATSLLVSHFILGPTARTAFFRSIASRLRPGGLLASADLAYDTVSPHYSSLLDVWMHLMKQADLSDEKIAQMRTVYGRDVALLPLAEVASLITSAGFESPVLFLQTGLIHAWYASKV